MRQAMRHGRQAALDAPDDRALAVADVGDDGLLRLQHTRRLLTPAPPRHLPGPGESLRISNSVVRIGLARSWPSTGCDISPVPKQAVVTLQPSLPLRPPQPPGSQS